MITNLILILITLILATQTVIVMTQSPRPVDGILPHPLLWELKRLDAQIQSILNWSRN